jgi:hypothetical protein
MREEKEKREPELARWKKGSLREQLATQEQITFKIQQKTLNGEINEDDLKALIEMETSIARKIDNVAFILDQLESSAETLKAQAKELQAIAKARENARERLKVYVEMELVRNQERTQETALYGEVWRFTRQRTKPVVEIQDEELIPAKFKTIVQTVKIDREAIRKALEEFELVPGAELKENYSLQKRAAK